MVSFDPSDGFFGRGQRAFELCGLHGFQDWAEVGAGSPAEGHEVVAGDERRRDEGFVGEFFGFGLEKIVVVQGAVAALAVDAVELEFFGKALAGHEALQFGGAHVLHVLEDHVLADGFSHAVDVLAGKAESLHDLLGHGGTDAVVPAETDTVFVRVVTKGRGLADIVEEHGKDERGGGFRRQQSQHGAGVDEDVSLGMKLRRLLAAFERFNFREDFFEQSAFVEQVETADPVGVGKNFDQLLTDALGADRAKVGGVGSDGVPSPGLDVIVEAGGEADGAEETEFVLAEAGHGIADGAEGAGLEVGLATDEVDKVFRHRIVEHAVDGEIAAGGVLFGGVKRDHLGAASVEVLVVGAEGGDFEGVAVFHDKDDAEVGADRLGVGKKFLHFVRFGRGGNVIIVGMESKKFVAHAAAGKIGGVAGLLQAAGNVGRGGFWFHAERPDLIWCRGRWKPRGATRAMKGGEFGRLR